jgi:hypothetical protein
MGVFVDPYLTLLAAGPVVESELLSEFGEPSCERRMLYDDNFMDLYESQRLVGGLFNSTLLPL